jgi:hypothetical protein
MRDRKIQIFYWGFESLLTGKKAPKNVKNSQTLGNLKHNNLALTA